MSERLFGLHAVAAALEAGTVDGLWVADNRKDRRLGELVDAARAAGIAVEEVDRRRLDELAGGGRHQGVVASGAAVARSWPQLEAAAAGGGLWLALDGVQDPHNLGACLRSAEAAGCEGVIVPADRAARLTPTVRKVAVGAAERLPFYTVTNLARSLEALGEMGLFSVGLAGEGASTLWDVDLRGPLVLVLGAEEKGLRRLTRRACDTVAHLPMAGAAESLNVSVAAGVALFEAVRQRR
ncbi:23S rRNA Gm-2251 2'-O-methyltransferase [Thiohalospira halophila DSM 15071]|uniref:23S rRNA Gm-2251 2'-O-methyltransferase n=1 Tax=Thiohalospira halophila DSM 15071 TaxID=1123397 RepID=A0A1I1UFW1_9GAMM|nr:23S rRNA (guanosine(2251)-2'-O)-methyltransferase RlmB [Thiohalospira halophila]SFD69701.1 23S rRNA Gm-2251 2'-O-methyltransferase [Thiohalospira halophila DSM 15071]